MDNSEYLEYVRACLAAQWRDKQARRALARKRRARARARRLGAQK